MSRSPKVTTGYIYTPQMWTERGITAHERREYNDGTTVLLGSTQNGVIHLIAWNRHKGTNSGYLRRLYNTPSDIGAIVRLWRNRHA